MLVVVTIMMMLVAAAATRMRPATESRRIREAARAINVYLGSARNRAMETGRPCGVILHRFSARSTSSAVMNLDQCEVPPCYARRTDYSRWPTVTWYRQRRVRSTFIPTRRRATRRSRRQGLVRPGDLIQLNCQGPMYTSLPSTEPLIRWTRTGYCEQDATLTVRLR